MVDQMYIDNMCHRFDKDPRPAVFPDMMKVRGGWCETSCTSFRIADHDELWCGGTCRCWYDLSFIWCYQGRPRSALVSRLCSVLHIMAMLMIDRRCCSGGYVGYRGPLCSLPTSLHVSTMTRMLDHATDERIYELFLLVWTGIWR